MKEVQKIELSCEKKEILFVLLLWKSNKYYNHLSFNLDLYLYFHREISTMVAEDSYSE